MSTPCRYIVTYVSAVTGNPRSCGYATKAQANKDAKALQAEGAKAVTVWPFAPCPIR